MFPTRNWLKLVKTLHKSGSMPQCRYANRFKEEDGSTYYVRGLHFCVQFSFSQGMRKKQEIHLLGRTGGCRPRYRNRRRCLPKRLRSQYAHRSLHRCGREAYKFAARNMDQQHRQKQPLGQHQSRMGRIARTEKCSRKVFILERFEHLHVVAVPNSRNAGCLERSAATTG
jgi:hypothetical protein